MAGLYVDTSALGRVLLAEPDAQAIRDLLARYDAWWSSELIIVELRRLGRREALEAASDNLLATISTANLDAATLQQASRIAPVEVRSLDAIHLAAALQLKAAGQIDTVLTYDRQLQTGCAHHGLATAAPHASR
jgi:predicted nucleic acid-binding protein